MFTFTLASMLVAVLVNSVPLAIVSAAMWITLTLGDDIRKAKGE